jgi:regulatory protein
LAAALSLRARALRLLALREHSRAELERKLAEHAADAVELRVLLDALAAQGWLDAQRFAASMVRRRARYGSARIAQELRSHGLDEALIEQALREREGGDEVQRALAALRQRHPQPAADLKQRARQQRFLLARGYTAQAVRAALKAHAGTDTDDDTAGSDATDDDGA